MNNLIKRTVTGIICILLILISLLIDQRLFALLFLSITILGLWEFYTLVESNKISPNKLAGILTGAFIFSSNALISFGIASSELLLFSILLIFFIFLIELYRKNPTPLSNISYNFLGIVYIAIPFSLLNYIPNFTQNAEVYSNQELLGFFYLVWINETGAYVTGKSFGRKKLFESVSPNKSWEGLIGGSILALLAAWVISIYYTNLTSFNWLVITLIIIIMGSFGDLFESMLKRSFNAKDSGNILPGHGGILDRFDGVLFAAPFVLAYLFLIS